MKIDAETRARMESAGYGVLVVSPNVNHGTSYYWFSGAGHSHTASSEEEAWSLCFAAFIAKKMEPT